MTMEPGSDYDWVIDERTTWPPRERWRLPMGPTELEIMRSCALRICFIESARRGVQRGEYEPRTGYAARVGTAFHKTMESLMERLPDGTSEAEWAEDARERFLEEIRKQEEEKGRRPREKWLPKDEGRVARATEAAMLEAQQLARALGYHRVTMGVGEEAIEIVEDVFEEEERPGGIETEVRVRSRDGYLRGAIDKVEYTTEGTRIIDYKSAVRDDVPGRYERQMQVYALLWREVRGEWPVEAELVYPFTGMRKRVAIEPETCEQVGREYVEMVKRVEGLEEAAQLATPGEVCQVCEFRPWCKPFWAWQRSVQGQVEAIEQAYWGFEGEIASVEEINSYWKVVVKWRNSTVKIVAPVERFPQLKGPAEGMRVRALEMRLQGQMAAPRAVVSDWSELFLVRE
jgi:CRISPR/Cas system-associated exonuclease Cas4 (RecB family)